MVAPKYYCYSVIPSNVVRGSYFDGTEVVSQSFTLTGELQSEDEFTQSVVSSSDVSGATMGSSNVLISKNAYVSLYNCKITLAAFQFGAGGDLMSGTFQYTIFVGDTSTADYVLDRRGFVLNKGSSYELELPNFEKIVVPAEKNLFVSFKFNAANDVAVYAQLVGRVIVDD